MLKAMKTTFQVNNNSHLLILYAGTRSEFQTLKPTAVLLMCYCEPVHLCCMKLNDIILTSLNTFCLVNTYSFSLKKTKRFPLSSRPFKISRPMKHIYSDACDR